jgi:hypothetical protein
MTSDDRLRTVCFIGNPCPCGWALDEIDEDTKKCEKCGRTVKRYKGFWVVTDDGKGYNFRQKSKPA